MRSEHVSNVQELLEELEALHIREAEIVSQLRESLGAQTDSTVCSETERDPPGPSFLDAREQRIFIGNTVEFFATNTVSGGQGIVTGYTKGTDPFLRIRRRSNDRSTVNQEVRRKPRNVVKVLV